MDAPQLPPEVLALVHQLAQEVRASIAVAQESKDALRELAARTETLMAEVRELRDARLRLWGNLIGFSRN